MADAAPACMLRSRAFKKSYLGPDDLVGVLATNKKAAGGGFLFFASGKGSIISARVQRRWLGTEKKGAGTAAALACKPS